MNARELALCMQRLQVILEATMRINVTPGDKTMRDLICTSLDIEIRRGLALLEKSLAEVRP